MILARGPKTRILFVIYDMAVGGAQKQVCEVVNRLDRDRFSADLCCIESGGVNLSRVAGTGEVFVLGARRLYDNLGAAAAARLTSIVRRGRYDVVEAYLPAAHLLSSIAVAGTRRTALVAARRHVAELDPSWMMHAKPLLNSATWLSIANSRAVKASVVERYGLRSSKVLVVPNIVEPTKAPAARRAARAMYGIEEASFVVASVASFSRVKDHPTIVRAFAGLSKSHADTVLLLAGDGPCRRDTAALARSLGVEANVKFLGATCDVDSVMAAADVFVHASLSEGLSNAVLEAMASGVPAVASDIPANREALGKECGRFFQPGDWSACARELESYVGDPARSARDGAAGRRRVEMVFNSERVMKRRERICEKLRGVAHAYSR